MDYGDQDVVLVGLGGVACVKPWPVPHLDAFSMMRRETQVGPPGGRKIHCYRFQVAVSATGFKTCFKDRIREAIPGTDFRKWFFDCLFPFCESSARNVDQG